MKISFLSFKKLSVARSIFEGVPWFLGRHAFTVILFFALCAMVLGGFLFYNYIAVERGEPETSGGPLKFREDIYQRVLGQWQLYDQKLQQSEYKDYSNPFVYPE